LGLVDELGDLDTAINSALELAGIESAIVEYYEPPRFTIWSLLGFVDAIKTRLSGLSAQDMILLEVLNHNYRQPLFLYQS
jgi:ClpP class serine protease